MMQGEIALTRRLPLILCLAGLWFSFLSAGSFAAADVGLEFLKLHSADSAASSALGPEVSETEKTAPDSDPLPNRSYLEKVPNAGRLLTASEPSQSANRRRKPGKTSLRGDGKPGDRQGDSTSGGHVSLNLIDPEGEVGDLGQFRHRITGEWLVEIPEPADLKLFARYSPKIYSDPKADEWSGYSFLEGAAQRGGEQSHVDRFGFGGHKRFGRHAQVSSEVSSHDELLSAIASGSCELSDRIQVYSNAGFDSQPAEGAFPRFGGTLTGGTRLRLSDKTDLFGEERIQFAGDLNGLTHVFGFELGPAPRWAWGARWEMGALNGSKRVKRRRGGRLSAGYSRNGLRFGSSLELHVENGDIPEQATAYTSRNNFEVRFARGWCILGGLNAAFHSQGIDHPYEEADIECLTELAHKTPDQGDFRIMLKYTFSPDDNAGPTDLVAALHTSLNSRLRLGIGYNFDKFSSDGTKAFSDSDWLLEIAGNF